MEFEHLLEIIGSEPVFETALLLAGNTNPANVRRQLLRWTQAGRIYQLRRGLYALAPPYQKSKPHPFLIANRMVRGSYVSLQSALAYHMLIPDIVPVTTSITTERPGQWETPLGVFKFHHVKTDLLYGYQQIAVSDNQEAFVATPEKALLDLLYLHPDADAPAYLHELRLQNLDRLDKKALLQQAEAAGSPKLQRAAAQVIALACTEEQEYEFL
ncbi:MAG: hypothetical protein RBT47_10375 [Anaerolineae bacterium]|jgi:predicted transcriptional regulator of viral defense system|nr:hypothetical protein [Anaerolineae bacterium]